MRHTRHLLIAPLALLLAHAGPGYAAGCTSDASIEVPPGFCATVFAQGVGPARHLAVRSNGDVYVRLRESHGGGGVAALRDTNGDGRADTVRYFDASVGTGIAIARDMLYLSSDTAVYRYRLGAALVPRSPRVTIVRGFPPQAQHAAKALAIDPQQDRLYVDIGGPSNACQRQTRTTGSPGRDPCPQLKGHAGIWRYDAAQPGQRYGQGLHFASGIRNAVALAWNAGNRTLYAVQHGRDSLHRLWPQRYTQSQSAELPAEEFIAIQRGDDFGWPYCYYDPQQKKKVLAPEYGGDGRKVGRCARFEGPALAFPAHWAPNDLLFYTGKQFPARYRDGAFVAFHGSWNRAPAPQAGYKVVFVPWGHGAPAPRWDVFAEGFAGSRPIASPGEARFRPMGLAQGPDGTLYIGDSEQGRIWRVRYTGDERATASASSGTR